MMSCEALSDAHSISKLFLRFSRSTFEEASSELTDVSCPIDPLVILGGLGIATIFLMHCFKI